MPENTSFPDLKPAARPLPGWVKGLCRVLGGLFLVGCGLTLVTTGMAIWMLTGTEAGLFGQSAGVLALVVGRLVGAVLLLVFGIWLLRRPSRKPGFGNAVVAPAEPATEQRKVAAPEGKRREAKLRAACNIFQPGVEHYRVWHFDLKGGRYAPKGDQALPAGQPIPAGVAGKGWQSVIQPRLNVAWLPSDCVFLRVVQLPQCTAEELTSMVELQLEKLSPLPIHQIVWNAHPLGPGEAGLQTVLVVMAELDAAEAYLGRLEEAGLFVDRLDVPAVDQLMALKPASDGACILPDLSGVAGKALVAWWFGGVLRSLGLLEMPGGGNAATGLRNQLLQMAWAGEIEGWLTRAPHWHLVAESDTREIWLSALRAGLNDQVEEIAPVVPAALALSCANRAGRDGSGLRGLLPEEYAVRYRQQFNDRLWMRSLGTVLVLYMVGVLAYFAALGVANWRYGSVEKQVRSLGPAYTNALDLKATFEVLNDLHELKYAALDCWKLTSELIPKGVVLDGLNFSEGSSLTLSGTATEGAVGELIDFSDALRSVTVDGKPVFRPEGGEQLNYRRSPQGNEVSWNFKLVLKRSEVR